MKKLITVCWSRTIEMDIPENTTLDDLNSPGKEGEVLFDLQTNILKSAADLEISWKNGEITDLQDI